VASVRISQKIFDFLAKYRIPLLIFSVLFFLANLVLVYNNYIYEIDRQIATKVAVRLSQLSDKIESYGDSLYLFRGVWAAHKDLSQLEWDVHMAAFSLNSRYPEKSAVSYIEVVNTNEAKKRGFTLQNDSQEHYYLKYSSVADLMPFRGKDLGDDPERLKALESARDTGLIFSTPPVTSIDTGSKLIAFYMPIYKFNFNEKDATVQQRRENIQGFMSLAISLESFIDDLFGTSVLEEFNISVKDQNTDLIYSKGSKFAEPISQSSLDLELLVANRSWQLYFQTDRLYFINNADKFLIGSFITGRVIAIIFVFSVLELHHRRMKETNY
jgi:CHASE1-domain containing sensor protein